MINYVRLARLDHWFKNLFALPGTALAFVLADADLKAGLLDLAIALLSICLVASANYVLNEWLDADYDRYHPIKRNRPSVAGSVQRRYVYLEYVLLAAAGLALASLLTTEFLVFSAVFLLVALAYNVPPIRTKDRVYLDALSESINNPLRLLLGWSAIVVGSLPPSSILLAYWMGGAFLMSVKRYAEFRFLEDRDQAALYRRSFRHYTENKLLLASFFYALSSAFFLGIFLIKYRIEFLLTFPLFAILFVWYLWIGMKPKSAAQNPEKLYLEVEFIVFLAVLCVLVGVLFVVDIPWLDVFTEKLTYD